MGSVVSRRRILFLLTIICSFDMSNCTQCNHTALDHIRHFKSINEWESQKEGIKHIETIIGRTSKDCMHRMAEFSDIQSNARLFHVAFWYNLEPEFVVGNAVVEIVFKYKNKYIIAFIEGFEGMVSCNQYCSNPFDASDIRAKYLESKSSSFYRMMQQSKIIGLSAKSYQEVLNGPIKEINDYFLRHKWKPFQIIRGKIQLNHGCLWYAMNLFSRLSDISVLELLGNQNVSTAIIVAKTAEAD